MQLERGRIGVFLGKKKRKFVTAEPLFIEVPLFQETCSALKNSWLPTCNFQLTILVFANLPIHRKLIHDNINLVFWKTRIFCLVLFWRRYITFIYNICIIIFSSAILKKTKINLIPVYLRCCKNSQKDIVPIVPISVITSISMKLHRLSITPE